MGVTIHFEGQLKSETDYASVISIAKSFAETNAMPYSYLNEANKVLYRMKDEKDWNYEGATKGIKIQPDVNTDPLWLEFDTNNYIQEYCKTQFADVEVHIKIVNLLRQLEPFFLELIVVDEGEYWETKNKELLQEQIDICNRVLKEKIQENEKMSGPYRVSDGRIVDLMEDD